MFETVHLRLAGQGQNIDVDAAAEPLTSATPCRAFRLKALPANTDVVFYKTDGTATVANSMPLAAGDETPIIETPDGDLANISVIAGAINQAVAFEFYK